MIENIVDVFNQFLDARLEKIHTMIPGEIVSYEGHTTRKANVKPLIKLKTIQNQSVSIQPIDSVPVIFPGSPTFQFLFPLPAKTPCMICFMEAGIGDYLNSSGGLVVDPDDLSRFTLMDAVCIPGLNTFKGVPSSPLSTIEIDDSGVIKLNGESKNFVTHAELNTALQTFMNSLNLHTHPTAATGPPSPPTVPMSLDITTSKTLTVKTGG